MLRDKCGTDREMRKTIDEGYQPKKFLRQILIGEDTGDNAPMYPRHQLISRDKDGKHALILTYLSSAPSTSTLSKPARTSKFDQSDHTLI